MPKVEFEQTHPEEGELEAGPGPGFVRRTLQVVGIVALVTALFLVFWFSVQIWLLVFMGILLSILLHTLSVWVSRWTNLSHIASLSVIVTIILAAGALGGWLLAAPVAQQFKELAVRVPEAIDRLRNLTVTARILDFFGLHGLSGHQLMANSSQMMTKVASAFSITFDAAAGAALVLFLGLYLAAKPEPYLNGLVRLFPVAQRGRVEMILEKIGTTLRHWIVGQIGSMMAIGVMIGVGLKLLGVPFSLALGIVSGILDFVPVFGPTVSAIPAILLAFTNSPWHALYVVLLFFAVNMIEGHVLIPLVQNYTVNVPPALTVVAMLLFGSLFGVLGLLLATPMAAALLVLVKTAYVEDVLERRADLAPR